ncbi:amino acid ABC transporter substrate-binding protein, PAAT family (TC 3.A.1.3.-) [Marinobacter mobilis]|uniref:Amino acid ABC transporter substrate-binding protein, PAAT family (TC 3.A.1.3.-) n=2 Tax=Marinobacter mobilis TaxID=488533 RepID=A0A1H2WHE6_9GAMM|nr:amino acid ABC transporter substrate-binding protein, PAAT family (TC 3.A.1.3.-) [Marinobacter mobilis]
MVASPRPELTVAYVEFPPLEYMDDAGQPAGEFVDLTRKVAEEAGLDLKFIYLPISRTYFYLRSGVVDMWMGLTGIPALEGYVLESEVSPLAATLSVWSMPDTSPVTRYESFQDRILILISGYTYGGLLYQLEALDNVSLTFAPNHLAALRMLERNRGHYLLDYQFPVRETLRQEAFDEVREQPVRTRYTSWLFTRQNPNSSALRDAFDQAYRRLVARGDVAAEQDRSQHYVLPGLPLDH